MHSTLSLGAATLRQYRNYANLAEAYLQRSQIVLQKGDVNAAATALSRARALMPKAPALTGGVNSAITQARKAAEAAPRQPRSVCRDRPRSRWSGCGRQRGHR